jgi:hypothetical protein
MPLTQDQAQKVQAFFTSRRARNQCPMCGSSGFTPGDVVQAPVLAHGGIHVGGPAVPMLQLVCNNCAHIILFAAVPIGIV